VGCPNQPRHSVVAHIDLGHQIEPEQREVSQIVLGKLLARQMSVKTAQSSKAVGAHTNTFQIRQNYPPSIADHYVLDIPVAVDEHSNLTIYLMRRFGQLARKFLGDDLSGWNAPLIELFETANLIRFEAL
jgi:hypothetical protein